MTEKMIDLIKKYKSFILYVFFGALTTAVNIGTYMLCYNFTGIANVPSTIIAWVAAVLFAYITNKLFVFESRSFEFKVLCREMASFFGCRFLTGVMDVVIMYVSVDMLGSNSTVWKILSNVLVMIANYVASKLIIFKK